MPRRRGRVCRLLAVLGSSVGAGAVLVVLDATLTVFPLAPVCLGETPAGHQRIAVLHPHWPFARPLFLEERLMRRAALRSSWSDARFTDPGGGRPIRAMGRLWLAPRHLRHRGEVRVLLTQALADRAMPVWRQTPMVALSTPARPILANCAVARTAWPEPVAP